MKEIATVGGISIEHAEWHRADFGITMDDKTHAQVDGIVHYEGHLGIHTGTTHNVDVTHVPSGLRVVGMPTLGAAMEFVIRAYYVLDWSAVSVAPTKEQQAALTDIRIRCEENAHAPRTVR